MSLKTYRKKRNFSKTLEPKGAKEKAKRAKPVFVVQKHHAKKLHYDFRLEYKGILLSWAIPKPIPRTKGVKRLAIHVEDHPLSYGKFEGVIPKGEYGAGTVKIWDRGAYFARETKTKAASQKKIASGLKKGHLSITLFGKRIKGNYELIHLKRADRDNLWILIKT